MSTDLSAKMPAPREEMPPRIIYALWLQGRDAMPPIVRLNIDRWERLNPDYRLKLLVRSDVESMLAPYGLPVEKLAAAALSDILRLHLLATEGGIWVDATLYPTVSIDDWLPDLMAGGFFAFAKPGWDRPVASWFLAAQPGHSIVRYWFDETLDYWARPRQLAQGTPTNPADSVAPAEREKSGTYPYYWLHYLFAYLLETNPDFAKEWQLCASAPADPAHALQLLQDTHPNLRSSRALALALAAAPVQKLNWRRRYPDWWLNWLETAPEQRGHLHFPPARATRLMMRLLHGRR